MTKQLTELNPTELAALESQLVREFELVASNKLSLDLSRGKPAADQLALSHGLEDTLDGNYTAADGTDTRNYGGIRGLPEARALGASLMDAPAENVIAGGNSSLFLMHLVVSMALQNGLWGDDRAWKNNNKPKLLTPVPGYDRHFALSETLGIEMVNIDITDQGPDLDQAKSLVENDPSIKGIWCVPKYSNPTGCVYSDEVVSNMASLPSHAAADDFVVLWDNAYAVHDLAQPGEQLASLFDAARKADTLDHIAQFASTSKITFAGAGVSFLAASEKVLDTLTNNLSFMMVGPDKVNQLRHCRFLDGRLQEHMQAHAEILGPKFDLVEATLDAELSGLGIATWTKPKGGYFVSLDVPPGLASVVVDMANSVGLKLTPAGATFPYGQDPNNQNVRIAPTFGALEDLRPAMQILTLCVKLASIKQLITRQT